MNAAVDAKGKIWMHGTGPFPTIWNGIVLTERELTASEGAALLNQPAPPLPAAPITAEELMAVAEKKGSMPTKAEVLAARDG